MTLTTSEPGEQSVTDCVTLRGLFHAQRRAVSSKLYLNFHLVPF